MGILDTEVATYNAHLPELLQDVGRFVLIKGTGVSGIFDTYGDALKEGYEKFKLEPFLVKRIMPAEQISFISRSVVPCHLSTCQ